MEQCLVQGVDRYTELTFHPSTQLICSSAQPFPKLQSLPDDRVKLFLLPPPMSSFLHILYGLLLIGHLVYPRSSSAAGKGSSKPRWAGSREGQGMLSNAKKLIERGKDFVGCSQSPG